MCMIVGVWVFFELVEKFCFLGLVCFAARRFKRWGLDGLEIRLFGDVGVEGGG